MRKLLNKLIRRTKVYKDLRERFLKKCDQFIDYGKEDEDIKLDRLYLGGLQREFTKELSPDEKKHRAAACVAFVEDACESVFNEILKEHSEALFAYGENEAYRNMAHNNLNQVLKVEEKIKEYAHLDKPDKPFDPNEPL